MTELEQLKKSYPTAFYEDGCIWLDGQDDKPFVDEKSTTELINEHYSGNTISAWGGKGDSRDPQEEIDIEVEGHIYIQEVLGGSYENAFKYI